MPGPNARLKVRSKEITSGDRTLLLHITRGVYDRSITQMRFPHVATLLQSQSCQSWNENRLPLSLLIMGKELFLCPAPINSIALSLLLAFAVPPGGKFRGRTCCISPGQHQCFQGALRSSETRFRGSHLS